MASLYSDENFPFAVVEKLRNFGHDVLTAREAGQANKGIHDSGQLAYAIQKQRAILTLNRRHFIKLHKRATIHSGIVVCTDDNPASLAQRIHHAVTTESPLDNKLLRINKPSRP